MHLQMQWRDDDIPCLVAGRAALAPLLVASMGAAAVLLNTRPSSPLAQPWLAGDGMIAARFRDRLSGT